MERIETLKTWIHHKKTPGPSCWTFVDVHHPMAQNYPIYHGLNADFPVITDNPYVMRHKGKIKPSISMVSCWIHSHTPHTAMALLIVLLQHLELLLLARSGETSETQRWGTNGQKDGAFTTDCRDLTNRWGFNDGMTKETGIYCNISAGKEHPAFLAPLSWSVAIPLVYPWNLGHETQAYAETCPKLFWLSWGSSDQHTFLSVNLRF